MRRTKHQNAWLSTLRLSWGVRLDPHTWLRITYLRVRMHTHVHH